MTGQSYPPVNRLNSQAGLASIRAGIPSAHLRASQQHDREVAAKALRDAAHEIHRRFSDQEAAEDLLTDRAVQIEAGEVDL